jgi:nitrate reductase gamma subunit
MYEFVRGPLLWAAFIVFIGGIIFRTIQFRSISRKKVLASYSGSAKKGQPSGGGSPEEQKIHALASLKNSMIGTYPVFTLITCVFHFLLFFVPLFVAAHTILFYESWGIRPWSLSEKAGDTLTAFFLCLGGFFLLRRLADPKVRALTSPSDYLVLFITVAPFVTGFIAFHQWFDYNTVILLHMLTGELMLIAITFTKLGHMIFFFLARFLIAREYSLGRGSRTW